jgi:hypothetical protein
MDIGYSPSYIPSALPSNSARRTLSWRKREAALFIIIVAQKYSVLDERDSFTLSFLFHSFLFVICGRISEENIPMRSAASPINADQHVLKVSSPIST